LTFSLFASNERCHDQLKLNPWKANCLILHYQYLDKQLLGFMISSWALKAHSYACCNFS
jgi:hypothetical protein